MWNEYVTNNYFLKKLYNKIPPLENIIIRDISIRNIFGSANDLEIEFEMPNFVDNVPEKWKKFNYNSIYIELDFYDIMDIFMETKQNVNYSSLKINKIDGISLDKSLYRTRNDFSFVVPTYEEQVKEMFEWINDHKELYPQYC